jgi:choline dehydrogenase
VRLVGGEVLRGDLVVLAAGAYASPAVLLRSGIGPADELRALGVDPVVDLPGVGRNLVDHPLVSVNVPVPAEPVARAHYQTMVTWRSDGDNNAGNGPPDLHLFACGPFDTEGTADSQQEARLIIGLVDPASRGRVRLTSADPPAPPHIDLGYLTDPRDAEYLVAGVREARRILDTEPLRSLVSGPELSPSEEVTDDAALRAKLPQLVRTYHHPVGTCRMGTDPDGGAVVDAHGRLHGVDNLAVVDASIMPRIPRANTNLPTMMLAERIAGWLTDQT